MMRGSILPWTALLLIGCGAARAQTQTQTATTTTTRTATAEGSAGGERAAVPATAATAVPIRGDRWTATLAAGWTENAGPQWVAVIAPERSERRVFTVRTIHSPGTHDGLVSAVSAELQQRGATTDAPRIFDHHGQRAVEFTARFPPRMQTLPMHTALLIERQQVLVISCTGDAPEGLEALCRSMIDGAWFGPSADARPTDPAATERQWIGAQGRFVQAPAAWRVSHSETNGQSRVLASDEGQHRAVNLLLIDNIRNSPEQVIEAGRQGAINDRANTITDFEPIRVRGRQGLVMRGTRQQANGSPLTALNWLIAAGPETYVIASCAGPVDDVAAHPEPYRAALESLRVSAR